MGVKNDIRWLKEFDERVDIFVLIAKRGPIKIRELKDSSDFEDWWPVKHHIKSISEKGLIEEGEDGFEITDSGKKVVDSLRTVYDIDSI